MNKNQKAFEGYQRQAVENYLRRTISLDIFREARIRANKLPASNMQQRIEQIANSTR
jgi:hypothetical protein